MDRIYVPINWHSKKTMAQKKFTVDCLIALQGCGKKDRETMLKDERHLPVSTSCT